MRCILLTIVVVCLFSVAEAKRCRPKAHAAPRFYTNSISDAPDDTTSLRRPHQKVYFWPSLTDREKNVLRAAFFQIGRRTCIKFDEQEYKAWYHANRWNGDQPYVLIRKSRKYAAYSDNSVEGLVDRTILYISEGAFNQNNFNHSRGAVMDQLVRFMGLKREIYRPDALSYIQPVAAVPLARQPAYNHIQLEWPFDPESITVPLWARARYRLTQYCPARNDPDIGAGQRVGLLTKWDTVKLNSMYCPRLVKNADPRRGPCVVARGKDAAIFRQRIWAYKKLLHKQSRNY